MIGSHNNYTKSTLRKLKNRLQDDNKKIHGVHYTNSVLHQRFITRTDVSIPTINVQDNALHVELTSRVEFDDVGLEAMQKTKDLLEHYDMGTLPNFALVDQQGNVYDQNETFAENVTPTLTLISVFMHTIFDDPKVEQKQITIAGQKFDQFKLTVDNGSFYQEVILLFGSAEKLTLFAHFAKKKLTVADGEKLVTLLMDKVVSLPIVGARVHTPYTVSTLNPVSKMMHVMESLEKDPILTSPNGFIRLYDTLYRANHCVCRVVFRNAHPTIVWTNEKMDFEFTIMFGD